MKSLYICYFGITQPLVQTQVLPYLRLLANKGAEEAIDSSVEVHLLTFEPSMSKEDIDRFEEVRRSLDSQGIRWSFLKYHKRPTLLATTYDIFRGALFVRKMVAEIGLDLLHARVHVPCVMAALGGKFMVAKAPKILFDIRGFFPEEYVDAGLWKRGGLLFKAVKKIEDWLLEKSDGFVVLTEKARQIIAGRIGLKPIEVIPCCVDVDGFTDIKESDIRDMRERLGNTDRFTAVYLGSFGGWYLTEETIEAFRILKELRPDAFALILTQSNIIDIESRLEAVGFKKADYLVTRVSPSEVPKFLNASDVAFSFIKPSYSKIASSPTKNAEYLACGLPILANDGIGDTTEQISEDGTGIIVSELNESGIKRGLERIIDLIENDTSVRDRCRSSAEKRFSLEGIGGPSYRRIYSKTSGIGGSS
jgi:glycosyltransferase involved in cell wall biosynthesis